MSCGIVHVESGFFFGFGIGITVVLVSILELAMHVLYAHAGAWTRGGDHCPQGYFFVENNDMISTKSTFRFLGETRLGVFVFAVDWLDMWRGTLQFNRVSGGLK